MFTTGAIISLLLVCLGIIGCIVPLLPGPQLAYIGLVIFHFIANKPYSTQFLIIRFLIIVAVIITDQILPALTTKKLGGSKYGTRGAVIGTIVGLFIGVIGIIFGPFIGARIGETFTTKKNRKESLKPAFGSFIGIAASGILKIALCIIMGRYIIIHL